MDLSTRRLALAVLSTAFVGGIAAGRGPAAPMAKRGLVGAINLLSSPGKGLRFSGAHGTNVKYPFSFTFSVSAARSSVRLGTVKKAARVATVGEVYAAGRSCMICGRFWQGDLFYSATTPAGTITVLFDPREPHNAFCSRSYGLRLLQYCRNGHGHVTFGYKLGGTVAVYYDFGSLLPERWLAGPIRIQYQQHPWEFAASSPFKDEQREICVLLNHRRPRSTSFLVAASMVEVIPTPSRNFQFRFWGFRGAHQAELLPPHSGFRSLRRLGFSLVQRTPSLSHLFWLSAMHSPLGGKAARSYRKARSDSPESKFRKWAGITTEMLHVPKIVWPTGWRPLRTGAGIKEREGVTSADSNGGHKNSGQ